MLDNKGFLNRIISGISAAKTIVAAILVVVGIVGGDYVNKVSAEPQYIEDRWVQGVSTAGDLNRLWEEYAEYRYNYEVDESFYTDKWGLAKETDPRKDRYTLYGGTTDVFKHTQKMDSWRSCSNTKRSMRFYYDHQVLYTWVRVALYTGQIFYFRIMVFTDDYGDPCPVKFLYQRTYDKNGRAHDSDDDTIFLKAFGPCRTIDEGVPERPTVGSGAAPWHICLENSQYEYMLGSSNPKKIDPAVREHGGYNYLDDVYNGTYSRE